MSTLDQVSRTCSTCRELISQLLEAREDLDRALLRSPGDPGVAGLRDKVRKLQGATEIEFLKAMAALDDHHRKTGS